MTKPTGACATSIASTASCPGRRPTPAAASGWRPACRRHTSVKLLEGTRGGRGVVVTRQGGEPTMMRLDVFRRSIGRVRSTATRTCCHVFMSPTPRPETPCASGQRTSAEQPSDDSRRRPERRASNVARDERACLPVVIRDGSVELARRLASEATVCEAGPDVDLPNGRCARCPTVFAYPHSGGRPLTPRSPDEVSSARPAGTGSASAGAFSPTSGN